MFKAGIVGVFLFACVLPALATGPTDPPRGDGVDATAIDAILQGARERYHLASITAEVRRNGAVVYARSLGYADLQHNVPATPQSLYAIGSITKSLTSYCILTLVDRGQLTLDSKLGDVLPDYDGPSRNVTILQMLTHTSGILDNAGDSSPALFDDPVRNYTEREVVDQFRSKPLVFPPGTRWQYSNSAYYMLSMVIAKLTGRPYGEAVEELLLTPFGLHNMVLGERSRIIKNRVMGYTLDEHGQIRNASAWDAVLPLGAGAYLASADDLTQYVTSLFGGGVPPAIRGMMRKAVSLADGTRVQYLPAAFVESDFHGHPKVAHAGGIWGFQAFVAYYPRDKVAITVLINTDSVVAANNASVGSLERKVARVALGIPPVKVVDLPLAAAEARRYVGTYVLPELLPSGDAVSLSYANNALIMSLGPRPTYITSQGTPDVAREPAARLIPLLNQGGGRFVLKDNDEAGLTFIAGAAGHVDVQLDWLGWPLVGKFAADPPLPDH